MCELDHLESMKGVNRRQFTAMGAFAGLAACTTTGAEAAGVMEMPVSFDAPGGKLDGFFYHPASGKHPAVIMWPDIAGIRPAKKMMARRLAEAGYAVFLANPYYRSVAGEPFADFDAWRSGGGMQKVGPWMQKNTPQAIMETYGAAVAWLDRQGAVDTGRGIGTQGYCMTGSWTIYGGSAVPGRIKGMASFHGGGLAADAPTAPVNLLDDLAPDARVLIAIAKNDDAQAPTDKDKLRAAAAQSRASEEIEVYQGDHGWTVLDSPVYNEAEAERAWARMLAIYSAM
ncbi:dienelactone hydrolase family protein [Tsuneonella sp. HG222]